MYNNETKILYEAWSASLQDGFVILLTCFVNLKKMVVCLPPAWLCGILLRFPILFSYITKNIQVYPDDGRGEQCTSADAAGFPMSTLLFTADEVYAGEINHAIRFILPNAYNLALQLYSE